MKCKFASHVATVTMDGTIFGPAKAVTRCTTHNWMVEYPVTAETLCPIGRIEEARDQALARIQMEKDAIAEELFEELTKYVRAK